MSKKLAPFILKVTKRVKTDLCKAINKMLRKISFQKHVKTVNEVILYFCALLLRFFGFIYLIVGTVKGSNWSTVSMSIGTQTRPVKSNQKELYKTCCLKGNGNKNFFLLIWKRHKTIYRSLSRSFYTCLISWGISIRNTKLSAIVNKSKN